MSLDLHLVEAFLAVLDAGGFRAAAARLGRPQPTISQQVRRLEEMLGHDLLTRGRRSCHATPEGQRFEPLARHALATAQRAVAALRVERLVVGAASNPGIYLLPPLLGEATELRIAGNAQTLERLESGVVDLAVTEWRHDRAGLESHLWRREEMLGIVPPGHRWAGRGRIALAEFLAEPLIGGEPGTGTGRLLAEALGPGHAPLRLARQMASTEGVKRAVAAGLGISVVLGCALRDERRAGSLVALEFEERLLRPIHLSLHEGAARGGAARRFMRRLMAENASGL